MNIDFDQNGKIYRDLTFFAILPSPSITYVLWKLVHIPPLAFKRETHLHMRHTLPNVCQDVTANTHID